MTSVATVKESAVSDGSNCTIESAGNNSGSNSEEMSSGNVSQPPTAWTDGNSIQKIKKEFTPEGPADEIKDGNNNTSNSLEQDTAGTTSAAATPTIPVTEIPLEEDVVDSALLSALRDPRERLALLKLEQVLIDFLEKQPNDPFIDVGGPYNTLVFSPSLGPIGDATFLMANGVGVGNANFRPQTTFQRCILHRLCDRFKMTREKSYVNDGFGYYIRIVKGPGSTKPPRLLSDMPPSEYAPPSTSGMDDAAAPTNAGNITLDTSLEQLALTSPTPDADGNAPNSTPPVPSKSSSGSSKPRKMKIMKRANSNVSSGSDTKGASKNAGNKQRNSLSEKERKYAEARARIFQQEETASSGDAKVDPSSSGSFNEDAGSSSMKPVGNTSRTASNASSRSSSPSTTPPRFGAEQSGNSGNEQATNSSRRKATYRNRQQEEADPDFKRGVAVRVAATPVVTASWNAAATPYYPGTNQSATAGMGYFPQKHSIQQQQQQQQNQQFQQQYVQQYYHIPGPHPGVTTNVVSMQGFTPGVAQQPGTTTGYPTSRVTMATGSGTAGKSDSDGVQRYTTGAASAPVEMTRSEQHFPALR
jgi:SUZ domain